MVRTVAAASLAGLVTMAVALPSSGAAQLPNATTPVVFQTLNGEGAWSIFELQVPWENELGAAPSSIDLNYSSRGSFFGREDLVHSMTTKPDPDTPPVDFAISGVAPTADELAKLPGGSSALISAPVQVTTLATLVEPPHGGFQVESIRCDPDALEGTDPSTWPPGITDPLTQCVVNTPYADAIRIPASNLAAMFFHYQGTSFPNMLSWNNTDVLAALGVDSTPDVTRSIATFSPQAGPSAAGRSDPDEVNYYMQHFVQTAAPDVWAGIKAQPPIEPWEPITERLPKVNGVTRDGAEQQVDQLANDGFGVDGTSAADVAGAVAGASPSMLKVVNSAFPKQTINLAQVKNANGDWVGPTPDAIDKAVDAGNDSPLFALTNKVAGAYPLVWVDNLYAPAHGLSIAKTESTAMLIRYLATTGQEKEAAVGEGRLSPALVSKALTAADALVTSNCVGADRHIVTSSDPGPLTPPTAAAMHAIGTMLHCVPGVVANTTTTTSTPSTTSTSTVPVTVATEAPFVGPSGDTVPANVAPPASSETTAPSAPATTVPHKAPTKGNTGTSPAHAGLLTALKLPLPSPQGGAASDRIATFLLGAALYLFLRKPFARLAKRVAT